MYIRVRAHALHRRALVDASTRLRRRIDEAPSMHCRMPVHASTKNRRREVSFFLLLTVLDMGRATSCERIAGGGSFPAARENGRRRGRGGIL